MRRRILVTGLSILISCSFNLTSLAAWNQQGTNWNYIQEDSTLATKKWLKINDLWYYFSDIGIMEKGWVELKDKWYYLDKEIGYMKTGWFQDETGNWYYLDEVNGNMLVNKRTPDGYYVNKSGIYDVSKGNTKKQKIAGPSTKIAKQTANSLLKGIEFPALSVFAVENLSKDSWGVAGSIDALNNLNSSMGNNIKVTNNSIVYSPNGVVKLKIVKAVDHYEISDYGAIDSDMETIILAMCNLISSTPQQIYNAIYQAAEYDRTIMRDNSYTAFGDGQILYTLYDDCVKFSVINK
jgi:hypothetical protein